MSFVVTVSDLDAAWAAVSASGRPVKMRALETMPWGAREFHMQDLDGCLLRFQARQHDTGARS
jgi:uncharacterized glyoxalase superfamily protein PhnB